MILQENGLRARDLIKKIDWYVCKGHEVEVPEYEAIFGYLWLSPQFTICFSYTKIARLK
jgi:hypothetical protein